ncbi:MAG: methionine synthase [Synechococcus sp. SB0668_bin_15]|nr:methionine synthase [Synechococcus sp. SB0668_bin_15]
MGTMARSADGASVFLQRLHHPERPVLVFDGGTGTSLQRYDLTAQDFGGPQLEGCNEQLVFTRPDVVQAVHRSFLQVGCDVIETNTFGATPLVLGEYGLADQAYAINKRGAELAAETAAEFSSRGKPRFVAGSMGPTTKLPTLAQVDFERLRDDFALQARGLMDGGADLLLLETCQDVLQIKAGLQGLEEAMAAGGRRLPVMVSVTMETTGTMLVGADPAAVVTILEPFPIDVLGLNCATGPDLMKPHVRYFSEQSPFVISCIPNAGLPENVGGVAHYRLTPMEMRMALHHFVEDLGVQIIGGCCGTTPAHIEALVQHCQQLQPAPRPVRQAGNSATSPLRHQPAAASIYTSTTYHQDNSFLIIGERLNASGSKKVRELLNQDDWDGLVSIARQQVNENAHLLDVNVDFVGRDGVSDMKALVQRLVTNVNLPLMLDSTEWEKMEAGLKVAGGKCILNSTNYEDGEPRFYKVLELAKRFGAGVVVGTIDEEGMARTAEKKLAIAQRAYRDALAYGLPPRELFFDPLALPISTGVEEDRRNAAATLEAIGRIRQQLPEVHVVLGISNVSFGLSPAARMALNSVFLHDCCSAGLDAAIVSPIKILPLNKISPEQQEICRDLIHDRRRFAGDVCTYDPLTALTEMFAGVSGQAARTTGPSLADLPVEERLKRHIIDGERLNLEESLKLALQQTPPLEIVNRFLLDGMKVVGELFGSGQMQLPFVLQSAQTMKAAVAYLEPHMEKAEGRNQARGKVLIATVKGDVHDIGKNLVDIILTNNGYEVINLGIKQDVTAIIDAQQQHQADCICMSGLLVKSTAFMKDNLAAFNDAGIQVPVILGGAALTPRFVHRDCRGVYRGQVIYGKDAFTDLRFMNAYLKAREAHRWDHRQGFLDGIPPGVGLVSEDATAQPDQGTTPPGAPTAASATAEPTMEDSTERSLAVPEEPAVQPPFLGARLLRSHEIPLDEVAAYLDRQALFVGQWQLRRGKDQSKADHEALLRTTAEPTLEHWLERCRQDRLLQPAVAYGYFPCGRRGNSVQVFDPQGQEGLGEFVFPRQRSGNRYCIADFYRDLAGDRPTDVLPMQAVTMGEGASAFAQELFRGHAYSDYLYFHGLAVQMAEALAEWLHARIRRACGFGDQEPGALRDVLAQRYRGSRYSFGYPACPNVADSRQQLAWLGAEAIGLTMDSSDQLQPEQSTTALVALHSTARYFST